MLALISILSLTLRSSFVQAVVYQSPIHAINQSASLEGLNSQEFHRLQSQELLVDERLIAKPSLFNNVTYITEVGIGTPCQSFNVSIEISVGELFVPSASCSQSHCKGVRNYYNASKSSTYVRNDTSITRTYLEAYMQGRVSQDVITIAGIQVERQLFGEADSTVWIPVFGGKPPIEGMLGLGPNCTGDQQGRENSQEPRLPNPFLQMLSEGALDRNMFAMKLPSYMQTGDITFGGTNRDFYKGEIIQIPLSNRTEPPLSDVWRVDVEYARLSHPKAPSYDLSGYTAVLLTSSPGMLLPAAFANALNSYIGAIPRGPLPPTVACEIREFLPNLIFTLVGHDFEISPYHYIIEVTPEGYGRQCFSTFVPDEGWNEDPDTPKNILLFGSTFLSAFYSTFDLDNKTIGLAELK
ncbi:MAG: Vacuolar protease A [Bogoriella megaspora]|nr:MAG: Vacuolar protease A [Bogoriella megaspora]